jgi:predicted transcriptional regulator
MDDDLAEIEFRRRALGVSVEELARRAGMTLRTLQRRRKSGQFEPYQLRQLKFALRTAEREREAQAAALGS